MLPYPFPRGGREGANINIMVRRRDARRTNRSIMAGVMGLSVAAVLIVMLFLALCGADFLPKFW